MFRIVKFHEQIDHLKSKSFEPVCIYGSEGRECLYKTKKEALRVAGIANALERDLSMTWRIEEIKP